MSTPDPVPFPPPGWVTNRQAAEMLGVSHETLTQPGWKYRPMLRGTGKLVRLHKRGCVGLYPLEVIERIKAAQAADALPKPLPDGFVDMAGAAAFFGLTVFGWKNWIAQRKVRFGQRAPSGYGGKRTLYAIEDLHRLKAQLYDDARVHKKRGGAWHVPDGYLTQDQACEQFGVSREIWLRWEREGKITCGQRVPAGPKLYKLDDIHRLLDEYGKYCPPYPDPARPGVYRVPLSGRDIKRREALIDADTLPLIGGGTLCFSSPPDGSGYVMLNSDRHRGVALHRLVLGVTDGALHVCHANDDPLDCRRANLLVRTVQQRTRNKRKAQTINGRPPTSRFKGVHWAAHAKAWQATIDYQGKKRYLGRYRDEIAAALAYDEAARQWFGEHARLNFPQGVDAWLEAEGYVDAA